MESILKRHFKLPNFKLYYKAITIETDAGFLPKCTSDRENKKAIYD